MSWLADFFNLYIFPLRNLYFSFNEFNVADSVCNINPVISWQFLVGIALFASVGILAFMYLFAVFFRNDKAIAWVKMELLETISTVFIIIAVTVAISGMCTFNVSWIFSDLQIGAFSQNSGIEEININMNMYVLAANYLYYIEHEIHRWMAMNLIGAVIADMGTTQFKAHPMGQGFMTAPLAGFFSPLKMILNNAMVALTITYVINSAAINILKYSLVAFPNYFLPLGIFFRAFEPTRRFGGTLIALAITFLIIYPILLSISFYITSFELLNSSDLLFNYIADLWGNSSPLQSIQAIFTVSFESGWVDGIFKTTTGLIGLLFSSFLTAFGSMFGILYFAAGAWVIWWVALVGFILPAFNTIMLVYGMRSLGRLLGEPVDITSLTRVI